jgi:hypothetical protein
MIMLFSIISVMKTGRSSHTEIIIKILSSSLAVSHVYWDVNLILHINHRRWEGKEAGAYEGTVTYVS